MSNSSTLLPEAPEPAVFGLRVGLGLIVIFGLPLAVWCSLVLIKDWNNVYFRKRGRAFVTLLFVLTCLWLFS